MLMRLFNLYALFTTVLAAFGLGRSTDANPLVGACNMGGLEASIEGSWEGALGDPPNAVALGIRFEQEEEGRWSGTFSVPAEGIRDLPLHGVNWTGDTVVAHLTPQRHFTGAVHGDSLAGRLVMEDRGGLSLGVTLHREGSPGWERLRGAFARWEAERLAVPPPGLREAHRGEARDQVDPLALAHLLEAAEESRSSALVVLHDGVLVGSWHDPGGPRRIEAMSVTKSVLSLAVGRLLALGHLDSLDTPVHRFFPEWREGPKAAVTVRHLLNHTSGLDSPMPATPIYASGDFVAYALDAQLVREPGTEFRYNNNATNLLAGVIGVAAGVRADRFIADELFRPLGISDFGWSLDPSGNPHGMAGLQIHATDLALLGHLVLQEGIWDGDRILPEGWITESLEPGSELSPRAGLLWWRILEDDELSGARADGYLGQYLVVYPDVGLVGVRMIEGSEGYVEGRDEFIDFQDLLRALR